VAVDLEAVAEAGLHDALAPLDLGDEAVQVGQEVDVDAGEVAGHDGAEEEAAEARWGLGREDEVAERHAPRGGEGARMPHLQLGQQHVGKLVVTGFVLRACGTRCAESVLA
jgi:hypothetical protein